MSERKLATEDQLMAVFTKVSRVEDRVQKIEDADLGKHIVELSEIVSQIAEDHAREARVRAWNWSAMSAKEAGDAWAELLRWRRKVLAVRWPTMYDKMTRPCWFRHPDVVEDLSALYVMWHWSFVAKEATAPRAWDWTDRTLPCTARRIQETLDRCKHGHRAPMPAEDHDDAEISAFIVDDLNAREAAEQG